MTGMVRVAVAGDVAEAEEIRTMVAGAGFHDISIRQAGRVARFPTTDAFVNYMLATRLVSAAAAMSEDARAAMIQLVSPSEPSGPGSNT